MEQNLSRNQHLVILIITLLLHAGVLFSLIMIQFDHAPREAEILLAHDMPIPDSAQPEPQETNWVHMSQAVPTPTSQPTTEPQIAAHKDQHNDPEPSETPTPLINEKQIEYALALAHHLLERSEKHETLKEELKEKPLEAAPKQLVHQQQSQKPTLTLAQLTQGFMNHLQESPMNVKSNQQGQASMEQLQQVHYMQKIIGCVVNSYKIHSNSTLRGYQMNPAHIQLALKKDGSIHTLQLAQSSGNITIDQFLIKLFQDASSSFPPLPSSFKEEIFHLPVFNVNHLESFRHVQGWYIDNTMH